MPNAWLDRFFPLKGSLNFSTPAIETPPGDCIDGVNYEASARGYQRVDGIERYDGHPKPSEAKYWILEFDAGTAAITEGQTVTGATSAAFGKALIAGVVTTGSYAGSNAAGYLVLTGVSGDFTDNENLQVAAVTKCVANGTEAEAGADNDTDDDTWRIDAIETARALITAPTGTGAIRGVAVFQGDVYCVRDVASAGVLYKGTTAGWVAQSLGLRVKYITGTAAVAVGATLTGATSAAFGVVTRVVIQSGTIAGGTAAGLFCFASITGTFLNGENLQVGGVTKAVASGASTANTLPAAGHYEFDVHNFFGASDLRRMYGVSGGGPAFEWDGSVFTPIFTGMAVDTPNHLAAHKDYLFLSFPGGSVQYSGIGNPVAWSVVLGAGEIGMGDDVTGFIKDLNNTLGILARNRIAALYGSSPATFVLQPVTDDAGGIEWTVQRVGNPIYMDDRGIRDMRTTAAFGDFAMGAVSSAIERLFRSKRKRNIFPTASLRCKEKNSYRVFYSDGTGVAVYLGEKRPRITLFDLGDVVINVACTGEDDDGNEIMFLGSTTGQVYQIDAGTSFDGAEVDAFIRLPFNHTGSPGQYKRFHKAALEGDFPADANIAMTAQFDYSADEQPAVLEENFDITGGGGSWDESFWEDFEWDSAAEGRAECRIEGSGRNCSITVVSRATYELAHTIHGLTLYFTPRRQAR